MKKLFILAFAIMLVYSANAQLLKNIVRSAGNTVKNSAENRAVDETNKQVDKGVNKFFDNLLKGDTTKTKEKEKSEPATKDSTSGGGDQPPAGVSNFMKSLGMSTEIPPHKEQYKFSAQIASVTQVTDENGKKGDEIESTINFDEKTSDGMFNSKIQGKTSSIIMDHENSCMIMLGQSEKDKTGIISKINLNQKAKTGNDANGKAKTEEECKMTKTGKTQTISGFNCSEYRCETADEISVAWVTKDFSAKNNSIFGGNTASAGYKTEGLDGMVIRYEFSSKKDKSSSTMTIKSIDMNKSSSFSLAGYQLTGFNLGGKK
jgi:hypothetical protein